MIKAAIFDFNGTLFFDTEKHVEAWKNITIELRGAPMTNEEHEDVKGRTTDLIIKYFTGKMPTKEETDYYAERKESAYREMCLKDKENLHLADGAEEFLDALKAANIPITVATSSPGANVEFYFSDLNIGRWFDRELVVYDDGTLNGKPAPDIYLKAAEKLGVDISECVVFEDAVSGIASARNAGAGEIYAISSATAPEILAAEEGVTRVLPDYRGLSVQEVIHD